MEFGAKCEIDNIKQVPVKRKSPEKNQAAFLFYTWKFGRNQVGEYIPHSDR